MDPLSLAFACPSRNNPRAMSECVSVLLCDDDPLLLELLAHRVAAKGYSTATAADGREAWEKIRELKPRAIVLDVMMPVVNGFELLQRIREDQELTNTPVIMLTARKQEKDIVGALDLGASDFLSKPFIPDELLARLARLIGTPA